MKVMYAKNVPDEVKAALEPLLDQYSLYLPHHCRELWIDFAGNQENAEVASTSGDERYGFGKIWFKPNWLRVDKDEREQAVAHEIAHTILFPLEHFAGHMIDDTLEEDSSGYKIAHRALEHHLETTVQALAEVLVAQQRLIKRA